MKSGEFSKKYGISRDTLRYYVSKGLLLPDCSAPQMNFTKRECRDMEYIQELQKMRFSIKEIHRFLAMKRQSNLIEPDILEEHENLFLQKKAALQETIQELTHSVELIDQTMQSSRHPPKSTKHWIGLPLSALPYLCCPVCRRRLKIENAEILDNYISTGKLSCICGGYHANIEDGIIKTSNQYTGTSDSPDLNRNAYRMMDKSVFSCIQKCLDNVQRPLYTIDLSGKVIMEAHVNGYFFLYSHFSELPNDALYIIVDRYPETLEMYKRLIETLDIKLNILFLADNSMNYPLRPNCVDYHINFLSDNEHMLYFENTFALDCAPFDAPNAVILGCYWGYPENSRTLRNLKVKYPEASSQLHSIIKFKHDYQKAGYRLDLKKIDCVIPPKTEKYIFSCQYGDDPLTIYSFMAVRGRTLD